MTIKLLVEQAWKEQAAKDLRTWAQGQTAPVDAKRLDDYVAGVRAGWDECVKTLTLHGLVIRD